MSYDNAVKAIKTAILQGQYEAAKDVNRVQLVLYFAIGKYLSQHTRNGVWGEGVLATISEQLRRELPGLRGFSETQMKDMRRFYEAWEMLDVNSAVMTAELLCTDNEIDIFHTMQVSNVTEFPVEDFFKVPLRKPHENLTIGIVLCQTANHSYAQYAVRDYTKPMGVATYKTLDDMPEKLRKALPDVNKMIEILKKKG